MKMMKATLLLTSMFFVLFVGTNFVNKYVLSVLRFTYPTIFQGWQTLVGVVMFKALVSTGHVNPLIWQTLVGVVMFKALVSTGHVNPLMSGKEWHECALWLPGMMCFLVSIYSGSRALANLPIPVFFAMQNIILIYKALADMVLTRQSISLYSYFMLMLSILSALAVARTDPQFHPEGYMWMCVHVITLGAFDFYTNLIRGRLKLRNTERLFCCYLYSVIVLAPSSYFLGDALESQRFPYWYFAKFYVGCILSGVLGMLMNLCAIRLHEVSVSNKSWVDIASVQSAAKILCSCASLAFYDIKLSNPFAFFLIVNHLCSFGFSESANHQKMLSSLASDGNASEHLLISVESHGTSNSSTMHSLKRHELQQDLIRGEVA